MAAEPTTATTPPAPTTDTPAEPTTATPPEPTAATPPEPTTAQIAAAMQTMWSGTGEVSPRRVAAHRLAAEARRLAELLVHTDADADALNGAADELAKLIDHLGAHGLRDRHAGLARIKSQQAMRMARALAAKAQAAEAGVDSQAGGADPHDDARFAESANAGSLIAEALADPARAAELQSEHGHFDDSPVVGLANPLAPPVHVEIEGETVVGWATFGEQYEGPPGKVHGGFVAAAFDDVLGMAQSLGGRPGMTGRLTIRYRAPHPLHTRIRYEAKLESVDGRKTLVTGASYDGDTLLAEAEGLFIAVDFTKLLPPSA